MPVLPCDMRVPRNLGGDFGQGSGRCPSYTYARPFNARLIASRIFLYMHERHHAVRGRSVLKALQRRYLLLEESSKLVSETLKAMKSTPALDASLLFLEIRRATRWAWDGIIPNMQVFESNACRM